MTMHMLDWGDYLKTGIEIVDLQHKGLVDLANDTARRLAAASELSAEEMRKVLACLLDYAETHFNTEEALMALSGVDERHAGEHRRSHRRFLDQVQEMMVNLVQGGLDGRQLLEFLGAWLICHIAGEDQAMGRQVRAIAGGAAAEEAFRLEGRPADHAMAAINRSLSRLCGSMVRHNREVLARGREEHSSRQKLLHLVAERTAEQGISDGRFRALFTNSALPVLIVPLEQSLLPGSIVEANPAACQLLGYPAEELQTLAVRDVLALEEQARLPAIVNELLVTGSFVADVAHVTKDAQRIVAKCRMILLPLRGQLGIMAILDDQSASRHRLFSTGKQPPDARSEAPGFPSTDMSTAMSTDLDPPQHGVLGLVQPGQSVVIGHAQAAAFLRRLPLFQEISPENLAPVALASREKRLSRGEVLFQKGDRPRGLYLVIGGQMKLAISTAQGNEEVLDIFGPQHIFGESEVVMDQPYPYFAQALTDAVLLYVGQAELLDLLESDAVFARQLLLQLGGRLHDMVQNMESYTTRTGTERVIDYLLQHAYLQSNGRLEVELPMRKHVVASLLHLTPETLSRIFHNLSEAGLITVAKRHVHIPDGDRLANCRLGDAPAAKGGAPRRTLSPASAAPRPTHRAFSR